MHRCGNTFRLGYGAAGGRVGEWLGGVRNCFGCASGWASKREDLRGLHLVRCRLEAGCCRIANPRFRKVYFNAIGGRLHPGIPGIQSDSRVRRSLHTRLPHFTHYLGIKRGNGYD